MNAISKYNIGLVELHLVKSAFDTGSTLARKLRAEAKAGNAKYRASRSPYDRKIFVTIRTNSPIFEDLLTISEVAILRDYDEAPFKLGYSTPAWTKVFNAIEKGKHTRRTFYSVEQLCEMIEKVVAQVADRNKHARA